MGTELGQRVNEMIRMLEKKAPRLRPNVVPAAYRPLDLNRLCSTEEQRQVVATFLQHKRQEAMTPGGGEEEGGEDDLHLVLMSSVDLEAGTFKVHQAKFVRETEANLYSVEAILNMHACGHNEELDLHLQHFSAVNGYPDSTPLIAAQEVYTLAYAIQVCISAASFKAYLGSIPAPLDPALPQAHLLAQLETLFPSSQPSSSGKTSKKRKKGSKSSSLP